MIFWSRSSKLKKYSQHKFTNVLIAILIIFIGLTPWLLSLWVRHNSTTQTRERIAAARLAVANRPCQLNYKRAIELIYKPSVIRSEISLASTMRGLIICTAPSTQKIPLKVVRTTKPKLLTFALKRSSLYRGWYLQIFADILILS